ncbi:MAG TPA: thioredoxin family protein [Candidatus Limnocylindrales bacterium]|nr:thioredoxin family protein [Candidatus Limnocylindrales bacterium]
MRTGRFVCAVVLLPWVALPPTHGASRPGAAAFPQSEADSPVGALARWKAVVLVGDRAALAAFYSVNPPAQAATPQGKSSDPSEEPDFWSGLRAKGLTEFDLKILDVGKIRPGVVGLALRAEMRIGSGTSERPFVVAPLEVFWSKQGDAWKIIRTHRGGFEPAPELRLPEPATPNVDLYPPPEQAASDIAKAVERASREHKRVILIFGGTWCFDCHVLDEALHTPKIAPLVDASFVLVMVNIGDGDKNLDLAKKYDVPVADGVPALAVLDSDGSLLTSQKRGEFTSVARLGPNDIVAFLEAWRPSRAR